MKLEAKEFDQLMKKADCTEWDLTGTIAFEVNQHFYSIGFYGECKDGFSLVIDEFLKKSKNVWVSCEPTEYQRLVMWDKINHKRKELEEEQSRLNEPVLEDNYENLGLKPSDFF